MNKKEFIEFIKTIDSRGMELLCAKGDDYADSENVFGNFERMSKKIKDVMGKDLSPAEFALALALLKIDRIQNLRGQEKEPKNESLYDSLVDLLNYIKIFAGIIYFEKNHD